MVVLLRAQTISECTFGVFRLPARRSVRALYTAARTCTRETVYTQQEHTQHAGPPRCAMFPVSRSRTDLKHVVIFGVCIVRRTEVASMKAYSKSGLRARSWDCRKPAFETSVK